MMYPVNSECLTRSSVQRGLQMLQKFSMYYPAKMDCIATIKKPLLHGNNCTLDLHIYNYAHSWAGSFKGLCHKMNIF
jgi:hypothetical protein